LRIGYPLHLYGRFKTVAVTVAHEIKLHWGLNVKVSYNKWSYQSYEIWSFHGGEDSCRDV